MSGNTSKLGLYLPGGGSSGAYGPDEQVDVDELNHNFEKIDAAVGLGYVTSGSRPSQPYIGEIIRETDTKNTLFWFGIESRWAPIGTPNAGSDSARDALFPHPASGDVVYRTDKGYPTRYNGSKWAPFGGGLIPIRPDSVSNSSGSGSVSFDPLDGSISFSNASAVLLNGIFSGDFRDYQVVIDIDSRSVAADNYLHFTVAGTAQLDPVYARRGSDATASTVTVNSINATTSLQVDDGSLGVAAGSNTVLEISRPYDSAKPIYGNGQSSTFVSAAVGSMSTYGFTFQKLAAIDGLHLFPASAGTLTGTIRVCGRA